MCICVFIMGCDFYTFYKLCIQYKQDNTIVLFTYALDNTRERQDWYISEHDEDFEELDDYYKRVSLEKEQQANNILYRHYPRVDLYLNGEWKCIASAKAKYLDIAAKKSIAEDSIVSVWKEGDYWVR